MDLLSNTALQNPLLVVAISQTSPRTMRNYSSNLIFQNPLLVVAISQTRNRIQFFTVNPLLTGPLR
jgi:hypothetical protein